MSVLEVLFWLVATIGGGGWLLFVGLPKAYKNIPKDVKETAGNIWNGITLIIGLVFIAFLFYLSYHLIIWMATTSFEDFLSSIIDAIGGFLVFFFFIAFLVAFTSK